MHTARLPTVPYLVVSHGGGGGGNSTCRHQYVHGERVHPGCTPSPRCRMDVPPCCSMDAPPPPPPLQYECTPPPLPVAWMQLSPHAPPAVQTVNRRTVRKLLECILALECFLVSNNLRTYLSIYSHILSGTSPVTRRHFPQKNARHFIKYPKSPTSLDKANFLYLVYFLYFVSKLVLKPKK